MNNERRKQLADAQAKIDEARQILDGVASDEQEAVDNMPDSIRDGEKGERGQEICDEILNIQSELEELMEQIEELRQ